MKELRDIPSIYSFLVICLLSLTYLLGKSILNFHDLSFVFIEGFLLLVNLILSKQTKFDPLQIIESLSIHLIGLWAISIVYLLDWDQPWQVWPKPSIWMLLFTTSCHIMYRVFLLFLS